MSGFWTRKKVLVGGGCGFLGSYLVPALVREGAIVTVVDNLENGAVEQLTSVRAQVDLRIGDLRDEIIATEVTRGQDVLFNLAAKAFGMEYSKSHHGEMLTDNLRCTLVPLDAARRNGVERAVIMSSSCVYPDDAPVPTPELGTFVGAPESVNAGYGWAKRIQELAGQYCADEHGMRVSILRPFNMYGSNYRWGSQEKAHVIPVLVKRVMDGEDPVVVWGSGDQRRNFLHGSDAANVMLRVVAKDHAGPVNIGYDDDTPIRTLAQLICEVSGRSPHVTFDTSKPEGQLRKCADATLLRRLTDDYAPLVSLRNGIEEMVRWYHDTFTPGGRIRPARDEV